MFTSFSTALSALNAFSTAVDVVGNNLANLNTTGYKMNTASFHDLVTQSMNAGEAQVGLGVSRVTTTRQFTQGAIQASSGLLDVAIQGDGFLIVKSEDSTLYTRAGNLRIDSNGVLTTSTGERVQGWKASNGVTDVAAAPGDISLTSETRVPTPTTSLSIDMNLNAAAEEGETVSSEIRIYDSLGAEHLAKVTLTKSATAGEWEYSLSIPDGDVETAIPPVTGTLTFDDKGKLTSPASTDDAPVLEISGFGNGAADMDLSWNLFNGETPRVTQFSHPSAVSGNAQNGAPAAEMTGFALIDGGFVVAKYTDGNQSIVGQLAVASIRNPGSLVAVGDNNYQLSASSALPAIGVAGTGGRGKILGGSTEGSTVDMAREFTNLIVLQRGYQANSKVVTTVDELSQETLSLKR